MYRPAAFDVAREAEIADFIDDSGPAHLVSLHASGLISSVVPLILDREANSLIGHLARPNPQCRDLVEGVDAIAIFPGVDAYISPSSYATKHATQRVVPTWNYEVVHAYGPLVVHDSLEWVVDLVTRLTELHEGRRPDPWSVDDTPSGFIETMAKGIVGIEIPITRLEGKRKLSQNRSDPDVDGVIVDLDSGNHSEQAVAAAIRRATGRA